MGNSTYLLYVGKLECFWVDQKVKPLIVFFCCCTVHSKEDSKWNVTTLIWAGGGLHFFRILQFSALRKSPLGLILPTKKVIKISGFQILDIVILPKIIKYYFQKSGQLAATKNWIQIDLLIIRQHYQLLGTNSIAFH